MVAAGAIGFVDLLFPLPAGARLAVSLLWLTALGAAVVRGVAAARVVGRRSADFFASLVERRRHVEDNAIINAIQFSRALSAPAGGVSVALMRAAVARGDSLVGDVRTPECVDRAAVRRHRNILLGCLGAMGITALAWPDVWTAVAPRFLDPGGDHPPWCPTRFEIRYETPSPDGTVYHGDRVRVLVELHGGDAPDRAWLEIDGSEGPRTANLFRGAERTWHARFDNLQEDLRFRVQIAAGYSQWQNLRLTPVPRITAAVARLEPPPYTGRVAHEQPLAGAAAIRGLRGTTVTLTVASNRPLASGEITFTADSAAAPLVMSPVSGSPGKVAASFSLDRSGKVAATVTSADGLRSRNRLEADLQPIDDTAPTVTFEEPGQDAYALEGTNIPLRVRAEDDVAVCSVQLRYSIAGRNETIVVATDPPSGAVVHGGVPLDLSALRAKPGDVVEYFATAADNCPPAPHRTDSKVYRITVISPTEYAEMARATAGLRWLQEQYLPLVEPYRQIAEEIAGLAREAEELANALQNAPADSPTAEEVRKRLDELAARDAALRRKAADLAERMDSVAKSPPLYDVQKHLNEQLADLVRDLRETAGRSASHDLAEQLRKSAPGNATAGQAVGRVLTDLKKDDETHNGPACKSQCRSVEEPIETLAQVYELIALTEDFKVLAVAQRDLARRTARFAAGSPESDEGKTELRRYGVEQADIKRDFEALREQFVRKGREVAEFADRLAAESPATRAADTRPADEASPESARAERLRKFAARADELAGQMRSLGISEDMATAVDRFRADDGPSGHRAADSAATKMASLVKRCRAAAGEGEACLSLDIVEFGESLAQMAPSMRPSSAGGAPGGQAPGESAAGFTMSGGDFALYGPLTASAGVREKRPPDASGVQHPPDLPEAASTESIAPERSVEIRIGPIRNEAVPGRYKAIIEAYFRRIAEENR